MRKKRSCLTAPFSDMTEMPPARLFYAHDTNVKNHIYKSFSHEEICHQIDILAR